MPKSRHTSLIPSPSSKRATNRRRSSITEVSLHGIDTSRPKTEKCNPCLRYEMSPISQVGHSVLDSSSTRLAFRLHLLRFNCAHRTIVVRLRGGPEAQIENKVGGDDGNDDCQRNDQCLLLAFPGWLLWRVGSFRHTWAPVFPRNQRERPDVPACKKAPPSGGALRGSAENQYQRRGGWLLPTDWPMRKPIRRPIRPAEESSVAAVPGLSRMVSDTAFA